MTKTRAALVAALLLGLTGLAVAAFGPEPRLGAALDQSATDPGCSSCDARHQRIGQQGLAPVPEEE